ncbi:uncharacterized protein A1O9_10913 [Exophiala aquamarina CBS 119918]|uniref:Uncharacterized protein n=1 Tax=Exophiala aquamarina CBS 119918 TaxID=1182545 RepID=A0A072PBP6_9EURO|nr:uncharacterized protein A1O9_10913 [Exophiala aquamarina CBS 119918]KEF53005.1 hypothetical protein A1O9_10913 [Exophiala aquamarina CBS 119918]
MSMHHDGIASDPPSLCTVQHSILQQERLYLLRALANEERRKERLTSILNKMEAVLATTDQRPSEQTKRLERSLKTTRSKLTRCESAGQALCNNLDAVVAQMQRLDDHQWRRAHDEYAQQTQHGLMTSLSRPAASAYHVLSPPATAPSMQMQPFYTNTLPPMQVAGACYQPTSNALSHPIDQTTIFPVPATPILRPLRYSSLNPFQPRCRPDILPSISSRDQEYYCNGTISPMDEVSTYSLNPWTAPALSPTLSATFVPPATQVFDLVRGLGAIAISGSETPPSPGLWLSGLAPYPPPDGVAGMQQPQVQGAGNSGSAARRRARKRRSA